MARASARRLLPERAPPKMSSFMAAQTSTAYNRRRSGQGNAVEIGSGPAAVVGDGRRMPQGGHCRGALRREGAAIRSIREPEDLPGSFIEACGKGFAGRIVRAAFFER